MHNDKRWALVDLLFDASNVYRCRFYAQSKHNIYVVIGEKLLIFSSPIVCVNLLFRIVCCIGAFSLACCCKPHSRSGIIFHISASQSLFHKWKVWKLALLVCRSKPDYCLTCRLIMIHGGVGCCLCSRCVFSSRFLDLIQLCFGEHEWVEEEVVQMLRRRFMYVSTFGQPCNVWRGAANRWHWLRILRKLKSLIRCPKTSFWIHCAILILGWFALCVVRCLLIRLVCIMVH